ncbi:PIN domain-containing protein [Gloeocapsopsis dulcis]|uniref:PIN domain-containing protein n=1 Tax=Gloeocapsopsis dulcis AAB1 = 1H9 TaxID=1433147 RepID=A0A6N8G262_9CHRO|nr:PIN domain-containing protein [Gloeocapsopsis dulcis]MUL38695.1 PIN domain-containing protein [Gloeocapsopsis dulcis AAB1 = 1H9]WNN88305.1 PIN domain-containing protein [Gloeocapsopsis dulcis]
MTRVYLNTSAYNRPFDDQTQPKIFLESQAVIIILQMIEVKELELVSSLVLEYENSRNPYPIKQEAMNRYLQLAGLRQEVDEAIRQRAENLEHNGLKAIDALHIACAEAANSDYFITCDKRLINRCSGLTMQVMNPVNFVLEISSDDPG